MSTRRHPDEDIAAGFDEHAVIVTGAEREAAGVKAVMVSLQRGLEQMGPVRTAATLLAAQPARRLRLPGLRLARPGAEHRTLAEFCENGAKAVAEEATTRARRRRSSSPRTPIAELAEQSRLLARPAGPAHRSRWCCAPRRDHYEPIAWDDAFALIADELQRAGVARTRRSSTPRAAPATRPRSSTSCSSAQFGTNNLPDCSNMCHESTRRRR